MGEISLAYATLTDPEKRKIYDIKGDRGLKKPCCKAPAYPDKTVSEEDKKQKEMSKPVKRRHDSENEGYGEQEKKFKHSEHDYSGLDHSGHGHAGHNHSGQDHSGHGHDGHDHSAHGHASHDHSGHVHVEDDNDYEDSEEEDESENEGEGESCPCCPAIGMSPAMMQKLMAMQMEMEMYGGYKGSQMFGYYGPS